MDLRELRVQQLPGVPGPLTVEGRPGLNLVLGPNGSGKTSLVRAALGLLWPDERNGGHLTALWHDGGTVWHASRAGGVRVDWQRDGQPHPEPPRLPPADQATGFRLGLLDLLKLAADPSDEGLAQAIRNQMAGGYDLAAMLARAKVTGREGVDKARALKERLAKVEERRALQAALHHDESQLAALEQQLRQAEEARGRAEALRLVATLIEKQRAAHQAAERLTAAYATAMDHLRDDDASRLATLREKQRALADDLAATRRDLDQAAADRDATGLPDGGPPSTTVDTASHHLAQARLLQTDLHHAEADLAAAIADEAAKRLGLEPWKAPDPGRVLTPEHLRTEARAVQAALEARAEHEALTRVLASPTLPPADLAGANPEALAAARRALAAWLAAGGERRVAWLPLAAGASLVILGGLTGSPVGWVGAGLGLVIALAACLPPLLARDGRRARADFDATSLAVPRAWNAASVRQRDAELASQEADLRFALARQRLRDDLAATQAAAAARAGEVDPVERLQVAEWLQRNAAYHEALAARTKLEARCEHLQGEVADRGRRASEALSPWLARAGDDLPSLEAAFQDLVRRRTAHEQASSSAEAARQRLGDLQRAAHEASAEVAALLGRLGLPDEPASDAQVAAYAARLADHRRDKEAAGKLAVEAKVAADAVDALDDPRRQLALEARAWPADRLATARQDAETMAAKLMATHEQITRIKTRRDAALHDRALDDALLAHDRAQTALAAVRDEVRQTALRRLLLERLQDQHRRRSEPPVLARARALLNRITAGRYDLLVADQDTESFRARDNTTGEGLGLSQLSDGTRAQLLLAARLAYIQQVERGVSVPLFLDESLTASDPARFGAVADAVLDLIEAEGRQVFYLTCDPADVHAWQQRLAARDLPAVAPIDLVALRNLAAAAAPERLRPPATAPIPRPRPGEDPADYAARLGGVPPLDAHAPPTQAHLLHLLRDDLPLLANLLERGVATSGQLEAMAPALQAGGVLTSAGHEAIAARARALAVFGEAWRVGRGRPVPAGALSERSGITSTKLGEVERLLASPEIGHDAARLVAALAGGAVQRLHQKVQDDIAAWLRDEGHLDERPALGANDVRAQVLNAAAGDLAAGHVALEVLDALVAAWWRAAGG